MTARQEVADDFGRPGDLTDAVAALLLDLELTEEERDSINPFELIDLELPLEPCPVWAAHKAALLPQFIKRNPGRRPSRWWRYDAPREPLGMRPGCADDGTLEEPRRRLGGTGTAAHEVLNYAPAYHLGIPSSWVSPEEVAWYTGTARDIHGELINPGAADDPDPFLGVAIDPADPPVYEAQACYLRRHGLFVRGEERRLPADAFTPEVVVP